MFTSIQVLFRKNHEASVWKIILPDCLAGICHYTRCDWLRYLSGHVKQTREGVYLLAEGRGSRVPCRGGEFNVEGRGYL